MQWTIRALKILKKYFNIDELKDKQEDVINELLGNNDVIGLLPTGYGKSFCYILPPLLTKKTIFIISPLISLMDDQKDKLEKAGIHVSALHSLNLNKSEDIKKILTGEIKIVFMSPETLISGDGLVLAKQLMVNNLLGYLAIDESHCLSSWGHEFRQDYTKLKMFRDLIPNIPILAVTATATDLVIKEIIDTLKLKSPRVIKANFDRPNLYLSILDIPKESIKKKAKNKESHLLVLDYINKYPNEKIIVYVFKRDDTETISNKINIINNCSKPYHAKLDDEDRNKIHNDFINGNKKVIISTTAFGMGIDQNVKCVIIIGCPSSVEEYYQQIGRAGRDGLLCETILYYSHGDFNKKRHHIIKENQSYQLKKNKQDNLYRMKHLYETKICRRHYILDYFGCESDTYFDYVGFTCNNCDNCYNKLVDVTNKYYNYYINNIKMESKYSSYIKEFELNKLLKYWKDYILLKKYTLEQIPENLKIKLPIISDINDGDEYDDIYNKGVSLMKIH